MTVEELIAQLQVFPPKLKVTVNYEVPNIRVDVYEARLDFGRKSTLALDMQKIDDNETPLGVVIIV